jgi:hypothetical protein
MSEFKIGLDFDGTVLSHDYPDLGEDVGAFPWLNCVNGQLGVEVLLVTSRTGQPLEEALGACEERGLVVSVGKLAECDVFISDRSIGTPLTGPPHNQYVDWSKVGPILLEKVEEFHRQR